MSMTLYFIEHTYMIITYYQVLLIVGKYLLKDLSGLIPFTSGHEDKSSARTLIRRCN